MNPHDGSKLIIFLWNLRLQYEFSKLKNMTHSIYINIYITIYFTSGCKQLISLVSIVISKEELILGLAAPNKKIGAALWSLYIIKLISCSMQFKELFKVITGTVMLMIACLSKYWKKYLWKSILWVAAAKMLWLFLVFLSFFRLR